MTKNWHPVIDESLCVQCGACIEKCTHGVYDQTNAPKPVVMNPEGCVDRCHGCGNLCKEGAITYFGEDTDWVPKQASKDSDDTPQTKNDILLEYLYLDLSTCERCMGTDDILEEVIDRLQPVMELTQRRIVYKKILIDTKEDADKHKFLSSPTIRINGSDICSSVDENACGCCSDISGTAVDCRVFRYEGKSYEVPPKKMLAEAILSTVFSTGSEKTNNETTYQIPDNLISFFEGKTTKNQCSCGDACC